MYSTRQAYFLYTMHLLYNDRPYNIFFLENCYNNGFFLMPAKKIYRPTFFVQNLYILQDHS